MGYIITLGLGPPWNKFLSKFAGNLLRMAGVVMGKLVALVMLVLLLQVFVQSSHARILDMDGTGFVTSKLAAQSVSE